MFLTRIVTLYPDCYPGPLDNSLSFDGVDDYVDCGISINLGFENITLECWVKTNSSDISQSLIMKGNTNSNGKRFVLGIQGADNDQFPNGGIYSGIDDGDNESKLNYHHPLNNNEWYYLVSVFDRDSGIGNLYINGELVDSQDITNVVGDINNEYN